MAADKLCQGDSEKCRGPKCFSACPPIPHAQPFLPAVTLWWRGLGCPAWILSSAPPSPICTGPGWIRGEGLAWLLPDPLKF